MSPLSIAGLIGFYVLVMFVLMAAPIGVRRIEMSRVVRAPMQRLWSALWPLGEAAGWSERVLDCQAAERPDEVVMRMAWLGRDGEPIRRRVRLLDVEEGRRFAQRVVDDSSLAQSFWKHFREETELHDTGDGIRVTLRQTDRYRGAGFYLFRWFLMRRELNKLKIWAETGDYKHGGVFEHPLTQVGFAILSAFILWPIFGLSLAGFVFAATLTFVVAAHELGHMAAFRVMGHKSARMIFIPLLGGVAIGGRPYDSRFEVAFSALMGAGFSAFLIPIGMASAAAASQAGDRFMSASLAAFVACAALFNLANLVPVWKFDGGQVLRQICPTPLSLGVASFSLLFGFLGFGFLVGFPPRVLLIGGAVLAILSLISQGANVKLKGELKPIVGRERMAIAAALAATFVIHASGAAWAMARILA